MEPLSGLWADLKKAGGLPSKGVLLSTCEAELTQLMKQIDVMVQMKRVEWQQERQVLQAKLDVLEQEHTMSKSTLEQKHQEIGQLRCQVDASERDKKEIVEQYEKQLRALKEEVAGMRKEYERLKKQYRRHAHQEKQRVSTEVEESSTELRRLSKKLDEYRFKAKEWDQERRSLRQQIETLDSQRKTLEDKCDLVQQQSTGYQSQLDKRRDMLDTAELTLRSQITQLEGQLVRARDTISAQDSQLTHLKMTMEDAVTSQRRALEEKEAIEESIRRLQAKVRQLETDLSRKQSELDATAAQAQASESTTEQMNRDRERLEHELSEKNTSIQRFKKTERHLRDEVAELRDKLDSSRQDCEQLNEKMASKIREIRLLDGNNPRAMRLRREKMEEKLASQKEKYQAEIDELQKMLAQVEADLNRCNLTVASLSEQTSNMEQQMRMQNETLERRSAEVQVANAQLEALRLESRHLRRMALRSSGGSAENAEDHLQDLQTAYTASLKALEQQNEALQEEVMSLKKELSKLQASSTLKETENALNKIKDSEGRRADDSQRMTEQKAEALQKKLDSTVQKYEAQVQQLQTQVANLHDDLNFRNKTLQRLGLEHEMMTSFVGDVEEVVQRPPRRETSVLMNNSRTSVPVDRDDDDEEIGDLMFDPVDVVTSNFLAKQEERTRELERKLDMHIEGLKVNMEATSRKFINER